MLLVIFLSGDMSVKLSGPSFQWVSFHIVEFKCSLYGLVTCSIQLALSQILSFRLTCLFISLLLKN